MIYVLGERSTQASGQISKYLKRMFRYQCNGVRYDFGTLLLAADNITMPVIRHRL